MRFSEQDGVVYGLKPGDHQAGADADSVKLDKYGHATWFLQCAALTGDAVLKLFSGASDGTKTTAETFNYRLADADQGAAGADGYGAWATSAALTLTAATYDNRVLIVEMDAAKLTQGQPFATLEIGAEASAFNASVLTVLSEPRYSSHDMPAAIP